MAKDKKVKEPWEKSIYNTDYIQKTSRVEQRKQKKGNTTFITLLVVFLVLLIGAPLAGFTYKYFHRTDEPTTQQTSTTSTSSSTKKSESTKSSSSSKNKSSSSSTADESTSTTESSSSSSSSKKEAAEEYTTVNDGEGLNQIAERTGVAADTIAELNGLTINPDGSFTPAIQPGQQLRIK